MDLAMENPIWKLMNCPASCTEQSSILTLRVRIKAIRASERTPAAIPKAVSGYELLRGITGSSTRARIMENPAFQRKGMPLASNRGMSIKRVLTRRSTQK
jgi:hypothetical protein